MPVGYTGLDNGEGKNELPKSSESYPQIGSYPQGLSTFLRQVNVEIVKIG